MTWSELSEWWLAEIEEDPAYATVVTPMLLDVVRPEPGRTYLDLGCGEGRVMRSVTGAAAHGVDLTRPCSRAATSGPVVVGRLPDLGFIRDDSYDGAFVFWPSSTSRTKDGSLRRPHGPYGPAESSHSINTLIGPLRSYSDHRCRRGDLVAAGRLLLTGDHAGTGGREACAVPSSNTAIILESAAAVGWSLERFVEAPHHELVDQMGIPRLLACRWRLLP